MTREDFKSLPEPEEKIPLERQIKAVVYELALRESAYPRFIQRGTLTAKKAVEEYLSLRAALQTLQALEVAQKRGMIIVDGDPPDPYDSPV